MLKSCLECVCGNTENTARNGTVEVYNSTHATNLTRQTHWPTAKANEKMFILPRALNSDENITIAGSIADNRTEFTISLVTGSPTSPDYDNVAFQFIANFADDTCRFGTVTDGQPDLQILEETPSTLFLEKDFEFRINLNTNSEDQTSIILYIKENFVGEVYTNHNLKNITHLIVSGDVERVTKLCFDFI